MTCLLRVHTELASIRFPRVICNTADVILSKTGWLAGFHGYAEYETIAHFKASKSSSYPN